MEVRARAETAGVACQGYRCSCLYFVPYVLEQFAVVLVNGYDIVGMLYLYGVSCLIVPAGTYHCPLEYGIDRGPFGACDVDERMPDGGIVFLWCRTFSLLCF